MRGVKRRWSENVCLQASCLCHLSHILKSERGFHPCEEGSREPFRHRVPGQNGAEHVHVMGMARGCQQPELANQGEELMR